MVFKISLGLAHIFAGIDDPYRAVPASGEYLTPADIQYLVDQVAYFAFEQELAEKENYRVTTETFIQMMSKVSPSLSSEVIEAFEKDSISYSRL